MASGDPVMQPIGTCVHLACVWEATARKPGNVTRFTDFDDVSYLDFILSANAIAPVLAGAPDRAVGETVLEAVRATRQQVASNTNLGIVLILAPLAAVTPGMEVRPGVADVLDRLDVTDSKVVYEAIRLARPGGLGRVRDQDVHETPTQPLKDVMQLAAERDMVARQYTNGFHDVFEQGVPALKQGLTDTRSLEGAIIACHLRWLAQYPDSLILRKRGPAEAAEASRLAQVVLASGWPHAAEGRTALTQLDAWLRAEGHSRNPGTSADLVTACLFVALRTGILTVPPSISWSIPHE